MGTAGAAGLFNIGANTSDQYLLTAGIFGLVGHSFILIWGKGGNHKHTAGTQKKAPPIFLKPLFIWRYPVDASFVVFTMGGILFTISGSFSGNIPLALFGTVGAISGIFGWLWPQDKLFFKLHSLQVCAVLYTISGFAAFLSGLWAWNVWMTLAGGCYLSANMILYTVRKENQSQYTIENE